MRRSVVSVAKRCLKNFELRKVKALYSLARLRFRLLRTSKVKESRQRRIRLPKRLLRLKTGSTRSTLKR